MKATITIEVHYDDASCTGLTHREIEAALIKQVHSFVSEGGITPAELIVDTWKSHVVTQ